jgi:uncharacterized protein (DUF2132 family)
MELIFSIQMVSSIQKFLQRTKPIRQHVTGCYGRAVKKNESIKADAVRVKWLVLVA